MNLAAVLMWAVPVRHQTVGHYGRLWPLLFLFLVAFAQADLYPGFGLGAVEMLRRIWQRTSFVYLALAAFSFVLKLPHEFSRVVFFVGWAASMIAIPAVRFAALTLLRKTEWWPDPVAVVGRTRGAALTIRSLRQALSLGFRPLWVVDPDGIEAGTFEELPVISGLDAATVLATAGVRVVLVAVGDTSKEQMLVARLQEHFPYVISAHGLGELPVEGVVVRSLGAVVGVAYTNQLLRKRNRILKDALDLTVGLFSFTVTLPVIALSALAVKLKDPGPAFFAQEREGKDGSPIRVWKIRTMYHDADQRLKELLAQDPASRREWEQRMKLKKDPRIIPGIGHLLRRFSIDELPQLWNVLAGQMSLVGPRPFPEYHLRRFPEEFRRLRARVRPGITGLWQVTFRSEADLAQQEESDTYYIRNWSLSMDLYILMKTLVSVLAGTGAY